MQTKYRKWCINMEEYVEVVVKIPKYYLTHPQDYSCLAECVRRGIPLPKGHGRLIDADEIQFDNIEFDTYGDYCMAFDEIDQADTIIEADKAESEE